MSNGKIANDSKRYDYWKSIEWIRCNIFKLTVNEFAKTGFDALSFIEIKGSDNSNTKQIHLKGAIDDLISAVNKGMKFQGNDEQAVTVNLDGTLKIVGKGSDAKNIDVADNNIKVSKTDAKDGLEIGLSNKLTELRALEKTTRLRLVRQH